MEKDNKNICPIVRKTQTLESSLGMLYYNFEDHHEWRLICEGYDKGWQRRFYCIFCRKTVQE